MTQGHFGEATARDTWIAGFPVMVPMIDVHTIGAGGGSIAFVDAGRRLQGRPALGRRQCPGPAAYGRGGTQPTVTDANVVLGRLDASIFLGGGMSLDEVAARRVIGELARELGLTDREAAEGVVTVINANMANAIRSRTVQKGIDPRDYRAGRVRRRGTAAWRGGRRHAGRARSDRAAASRHHLGGRAC